MLGVETNRLFVLWRTPAGRGQTSSEALERIFQWSRIHSFKRLIINGYYVAWRWPLKGLRGKLRGLHHLDLRDRAIAEEAVDPGDDSGPFILYVDGAARRRPDNQRATCFLSRLSSLAGPSDSLGRGMAGEFRTDDLGPVAHHIGLRKAMPGKGRPRDLAEMLSQCLHGRFIDGLMTGVASLRSTMAKRGPEPDLTSQLLDWYDANARVLPWRALAGEIADPYRVWLSEIMLQQTTVPAVKAYFEKFVKAWPTVEDLAAAPLDDVLKAWAGLGYYARARNLHACARNVITRFGGNFPDTEAELRSLPGIGPYTAGAIAAIAFDRPHAAVDGNVERVISRFYAIETPLPDSKPAIRDKAQALVPDVRAGDFAQAMMDLGATVCTPKSPNCLICPWTEHCAGRMAGIASELPRKRPKMKVPTRKGVAFWIERDDGAVLLRRRPEMGLLGGMMEVPSSAWAEAAPDDPEAAAPLAASWTVLSGVVEHTFTHFHLEIVVHKTLEIGDGVLRDDGGYRWVRREDLPGEALPTVMRKIVAHALKN